jgi:hypothetical protein
VVDRLIGHAAQDRDFGDQLLQVALGTLVKAGEAGAVQTVSQGTDARADRHLIVVEDDQEFPVQMAGVVECFEDNARRERAVADDSNAVAVRMAQQFIP